MATSVGDSWGQRSQLAYAGGCNGHYSRTLWGPGAERHRAAGLGKSDGAPHTARSPAAATPRGQAAFARFERLLTAIGSELDLAAADSFGINGERYLNESDNSYRKRLLAMLLRLTTP